MDSDEKLKRYSKKSYSETVDFPVEIVGRDGDVRRYSFEASVRLYQRRVLSAGLRYVEKEVIEAEQAHCRARVEQLRRSVLAGAPAPIVEALRVAGAFGGEIVACLDGYFDSLEELVLSAVEVETGRVSLTGEEDRNLLARGPLVWFASCGERSHLIYLYQFGEPGVGAGKGGDRSTGERESFFQRLRDLNLPAGSEREQVVAFHHTADCGVLLTSDGEEAGSSKWRPSEALWREPKRRKGEDGAVALCRDGLRALGAGQRERAVELFESSIEKTPWQQRAHLGLLVSYLSLAKYGEAELASRMAMHHFPEEHLFNHFFALVLYLQSRRREALEQLREVDLEAMGADELGFLARLAFEEGDGSLASRVTRLAKQRSVSTRRSRDTRLAVRWLAQRYKVAAASAGVSVWVAVLVVGANLPLAAGVFSALALPVVGLNVVNRAHARALREARSHVGLTMTRRLMFGDQ